MINSFSSGVNYSDTKCRIIVNGYLFTCLNLSWLESVKFTGVYIPNYLKGSNTYNALIANHLDIRDCYSDDLDEAIVYILKKYSHLENI